MAEPDGMIPVGSSLGTRWGFIASNFAGDSYLWKRNNVIFISLVASKRTGAFGELVRAIQKDGLQVDVPTPLGQMQRILEHWGAKQRWERTPDGDGVELWRIPLLDIGKQAEGDSLARRHTTAPAVEGVRGGSGLSHCKAPKIEMRNLKAGQRPTD